MVAWAVPLADAEWASVQEGVYGSTHAYSGRPGSSGELVVKGFEVSFQLAQGAF